jgi:hypothetical protein
MRRLGIVLSLSLIFTACSTSPPQQNPQAKNQIIECSEASSFIGEENTCQVLQILLRN